MGKLELLLNQLDLIIVGHVNYFCEHNSEAVLDDTEGVFDKERVEKLIEDPGKQDSNDGANRVSNEYQSQY